MIVVTGGAGFIGSVLVHRLNEFGYDDIIIVDELAKEEKWKNLYGLKFNDFIHKDVFIRQIMDDIISYDIETIFHLGACSCTTEIDADYLLTNNYHYSQELAKYCLKSNSRFIYASSAATYGDGSNGFDDDEEKLESLRPLNMYGNSKQLFDLWMKRMGLLEKFVGLKYFNVYGPNEYHKGDMRSVVHKSYEQIMEMGKVRLFKSNSKEFKNGEQMRDFIYVKDAVDMTIYFMDKPNINGLFNIGTGEARTWNDLSKSMFESLGKPINIEYIDMPKHLVSNYQNFTQANMKKFLATGYDKSLYSLEEGVKDYVQNYLLKNQFIGY
ncbi:MAG: ADP-glyceromanno-heptose 6-epimerase [Ignavibacteriales bacterium]|nr:ADP-glyceromanno-heptose 6-epimerase [Ignavibacteriales bacterium]